MRFYVVNNVRNEVVSEWDDKGRALDACRAENWRYGPGGLYGVKDEHGRREFHDDFGKEPDDA